MTTKTKLQKWGNSHGVRLSKALLEQIGINLLEKEINFEIKIEDNSIILKPIKTMKKEISYLEELFFDYNPDDLPDKIDWDEEVYGNEVF